MASAVDNVAKIAIQLETSNVFSEVKKIQDALNSLSIKDINAKVGIQSIETVSKTVEKATKNIKTLEQQARQAKKALDEAYSKNYKNVDWVNSDEHKQLQQTYLVLKKTIDDKNKALEQYAQSVGLSTKKVADSHREATKVVKQEVEKRLSYEEQARQKEHEIAVKYANDSGYPTSLVYKNDKEEYQRLNYLNRGYKNSISVAEISNYKQAIAQVDKYIQENLFSDPSYRNSDAYQKDLQLLKKLKDAYSELRAEIKSYTETQKESKVIEEKKVSTYEQAIRELTNSIQVKARTTANYMGSDAYKEDIDNLHKMQNEWNKIRSDIKGTTEEIKKQPKEAKNVENQFKNYQAELAKIEQKATVVFHELSGKNLTTAKQVELRKELQRLTKEYQNLNKESVAFRKQVGISSSRGFYDLNNTYDYFLAKFRSKVTAGIASQVEQFAMNAIPNFVNTMATFQQNRTNFAQIMPNAIGDDVTAMNQAMRDFTQIASDYGATVQDVVEAGRLWGRQYKDLNTIQALVRNTTKLSITDNMNLVEVNKGLEATMQQYKVELKDATEAERVSGHVVDSWAKLADNAVVTASDLAKANEQSAGAAYQMGISFDYLNAMIATMSGATGKAGAEIGRSIRSMLVSMNTPKAQKFFDSLGIATKELGTDGVLRVRSYEKVITELMQKLKNNPNDVSKGILALSGGKYQYNNVMALLKNYDQLVKNLDTVRTSSGWADAQVAMQYDTISRQINALNADFQQLIISLDEAGASNGIVTIVQGFRELVQILSSIKPQHIQYLTATITGFLAFKGLQSVVPLIYDFGINLATSLRTLYSMPSIISSVRNNVLLLSNAFKVLSMSLSYIGLAFTALYSLYTLYDAYKTKTEGLSNSEIELSNSVKSSIDGYKDKADKIKELNKIIQDNTAITKDDTKTTKEQEVANQKIIEAKQKLLELLPKESREKVLASGYSKEAIDKESQAIEKLARAEYDKYVKSLNYQISTTENVIKQTQSRIDAYEQEINVLVERNSLLLQAEKSAEGAGFLSGNFDLRSNREYNEEAITNLNEEVKKLKSDLEKRKQEVAIAKQRLKDISTGVNIAGQGGSVATEENDNNKKGSTSTPEQKQKAIQDMITANTLQAEYNRLQYEAKANQISYETNLKKINEELKYSTNLQDAVNKKDELFTNRLKEISDEEQNLTAYRDKLIKMLDEEISKNSEVAQQIGYSINATDSEKIKTIELNKEIFNQVKAWNNISTKITAVNAQLENTKKKYQEVSTAQKNGLVETPEQAVNNAINNYNRKYNIDSANASTLPFDTLTQNRLKIQNLQNVLAKEYALKKYYEDMASKLSKDTDKADLEMYNNYLMQVEEKIAQHNAQLYNMQNEEAIKFTQSVSQTMSSQFSTMLLEGQSFKDTMKNIWNDLCSYIIQRLLQVYVFEQLVNFIPTGKKHTGGNITAGQSMANQGFDPTFGIKLPSSSHTGSTIGGYPKMHTGGMVAKGRLGVVPQLKNDEVIRTLQVGEEVNSIQDRRSNEILATVAMKAIDARNQQPNNVNIVALDSKSFAEYLNDNADILTAVLAKQGALGRR